MWLQIVADFCRGAFVGSTIHNFLTAIGVLGLIIPIAVYIYFALAWSKIARNLKYRHYWLAWIPFANIAMILQLGQVGWAWIFLLFIPVFGVLAVIALMTFATWKIFEHKKYSGWLSLTLLLNFIPILSGMGTFAYLIVIGVVAWKKKPIDILRWRKSR